MDSMIDGGKRRRRSRSRSRRRASSALRRFAAAKARVKKSHPSIKSFKKGSKGHKLVCRALKGSKPRSCRRSRRSRSRSRRRRSRRSRSRSRKH
jgi:hypothetical protein